MENNEKAYIRDWDEGKNRGYIVTLGAGIHTYGIRHLDGNFVVELNSGHALAIRKYGHEACQVAWKIATATAKNLSGNNFVDETNPKLRESCLELRSVVVPYDEEYLKHVHSDEGVLE